MKAKAKLPDSMPLSLLTVGDLRALLGERAAKSDNDQQPHGWVSVSTAARVYGVTDQTIRNWIRAGAPARNFGTRRHASYRVDLDAFEQWTQTKEARR